jgi:predicted DNA binding protein
MTATIAEVELPATDFALYDSLSSHEDLSCEMERVVAHDADRVVPFVWMTATEPRTEIEATLRDDPSVADLELLADLDDEWLYQMEWVSQIETLVHILLEEEGTVLAAQGSDHDWHLRILVSDRDALSRTYDYCNEKGMTLEIRNIYELDQSREGRFGLTNEQQTTLTAAYKQGYYEIPRQAAAKDLADEVGVSHQALSERLRRGHGNLVENALILGQGADDPTKRVPK